MNSRHLSWHLRRAELCDRWWTRKLAQGSHGSIRLIFEWRGPVAHSELPSPFLKEIDVVGKNITEYFETLPPTEIFYKVPLH